MTEKLGDDFSALVQKLEGGVRTATYDSQFAYKAAQVKYYQERSAAIAAGEPTWIARDFDEGEIHHYDYYRERGYVGSIEENAKELTCKVHTADEQEYFLTGPGQPIFEAVSILENKII